MTFRKINKKWLVESDACSLLEAVSNVFIPAKEEREEKKRREKKRNHRIMKWSPHATNSF